MSIKIGKDYVKTQCDLNNKMLLKLDVDMKMCCIQLNAIKMRVTALQMQMTAMTIIYQDILELRKIIILLNPHLKKTRCNTS